MTAKKPDFEEIRRRRQRKALRETAGAWKDQDHPELKDGAAAWVHRMREEDKVREEERLARMRPYSTT